MRVAIEEIVDRAPGKQSWCDSVSHLHDDQYGPDSQHPTLAGKSQRFADAKFCDRKHGVAPSDRNPSAYSELKVPFLGQVSLADYHADENAFKRSAKKTGYQKSQVEYRRAVERTLREDILWIAKNVSSPDCGICIRLFNNNLRSQRLSLTSASISHLPQ